MKRTFAFPLRPIAACAVMAAVALTLSIADAAPDLDSTAEATLLASVSQASARTTPVERVTSHGLARDDRPPDELRLNLDGRDIVIIFASGDVELGEGLTIDEASKAFWKRVGELAPSFCNGRASERAATPQH